jgi:hypothetical protein
VAYYFAFWEINQRARTVLRRVVAGNSQSLSDNSPKLVQFSNNHQTSAATENIALQTKL